MARLGEQIIAAGAGHQLVDRLREKKRLLAAGDPAHERIRTALIIGGGGMRGVYSTGITAALEAFGFGDVFDDAIGISAGACAVAYFLAGQAAVGPSVYYEDLPNKQFINVLRPKNIMDIGFLEHVFREVKPLDQAAIRESRTRMHVGMTEVATGKGVYLNLSEYPQLDVVSAIITSSALPVIVKQQAAINGTLYADGTSGCTTPIDFAIKTLGATDTLVVMNYPFSREKLPASEHLLDRIILRKFSKDFRTAHIARLKNHGFASGKQYADDINIGVLCPEKQFVSPLSKNAKALKALAAYAQNQASAIFGDA
ncbi:MAG TPA: patatin-like phospholipase family protein [Candidatus Saccharimonadales bacterium]|jgi:predicted patatin/cPLA2 family phospholipase